MEEEFTTTGSGDIMGIATTAAAAPAPPSIDVIPEGVLSSILSKLVEARRIAQAGTVCRRWRSAAAGVHVLRLDFRGDFVGACLSLGSDSSSDDEITDGDDDSSSSCSGSEHEHGIGGVVVGQQQQHRRRHWSTREILHIYSQMLSRCSSLRELLIDRFDCRCVSSEQRLTSWVANLHQSLEVFHFRGRFELGGKLVRALSSCGKLRSLELIDEMWGDCGCQCSKFEITSEAIAFPSLKRCVFQDMLMTDAKLERFVSACPVLEDLEVVHLYGLEAPSIVAANLVRFTLVSKAKDNCFFANDMPLVSLKLSCPKLESLAIHGVKEVHLDGSSLVELRALCYFKPVFKKMPSLKVLEIANRGWTTSRVSQFLDIAKLAHEISMRVKLSHHQSRRPPMLFPDIFEGFTELRTLQIGLDMFEAFQVGSFSKQLMPSRPPLEDVTLFADSGNKDTINLLASILECDTLSSVKLNLLERPSGAFCTSLLKLQSQYHKVSIAVNAQDTDDEDESEYEDDISFSDADNEDEDDDDDDDERHADVLDEDDYEDTPTESETEFEDLP